MQASFEVQLRPSIRTRKQKLLAARMPCPRLPCSISSKTAARRTPRPTERPRARHSSSSPWTRHATHLEDGVALRLRLQQGPPDRHLRSAASGVRQGVPLRQLRCDARQHLQAHRVVSNQSGWGLPLSATPPAKDTPPLPKQDRMRSIGNACGTWASAAAGRLYMTYSSL